MFTTLTECIDRATQQYQASPNSALSLQLERFALVPFGANPENGTANAAVLAERFRDAGFLAPGDTTSDSDAFGLVQTVRYYFGLPQV